MVSDGIVGIESDQKIVNKKHMKFEVRKNQKDETYWILKARNGESICWSEGYASLESAIHSINLVKMNSMDAIIIDATKEESNG